MKDSPLIEKTSQRLELGSILERLAGLCSFTAGAALARETTPASELATARVWQEETAEAVRALDKGAGLSLGGAHDMRELVFRAQRGIAMEPQELLDLRDTLRRSTTLRRTLGRLSGQYPRLAALIADLEECAALQGAIARAIGENGDVLDTASVRLATLRRELKVAFERLQQKLNRIVSARGNALYLQETLISMRRGRYVIPIKAEHRGKIGGIVHDTSASGATLWLEPLATVELNNAWRELQLSEEKEIRRILLELSEQVGAEAEAIVRTVETLAQLDVIRARALLAIEMEAVAPALRPWPAANERPDPGSVLRLRAARHPLLGADAVPVDVTLNESGWMVVITGPNTGGKTVTLKTVGLLTLMAQCGMHLPVEEAELTVFGALYADIGDEQSIEQSLSTFSSHLTNIIGILAECDGRSLVLLDELGAGTDPTEGAALARALLNELHRRRVTTLVTTHHPELKLFAVQRPGMRNASMEFDHETLSPTFRLISGLPGRSNALLIAAGLGLPAEILADARAMVPIQDLVADDLLDELHRSRDETQRELEQARELRAESEERASELRQRLRDIDEERREILLNARQEAQQQLAEVSERLNELRGRLQRAGQSLAPLSELEAALAAAHEGQWRAEIEPLADIPARDWLPGLGDSVMIERLSARGLIIELDGEEAIVQMGSLRARVDLEELAPISEAQKDAEERQPQQQTEQNTRLPASPGIELDLRGQRVEEAVERLERYLDAASAAGLPFGRIIHGKGTGALRRAVRERLRGHPLISAAQAADARDGGEGVTIARLVSLA